MLCALFCFYSLSLNSSAVEYDEETGRLLWSDEELQQFGAVFDEDGNYYFPAGTYHPDELYAINPLLVTEPYNSNFDMYQLPWESFPSAVQDIMYMNLDGYGFLTTDSTRFIIPFVVMIVSQTAVEIYAGTNLCLGMRDDNGRLCICSIPYLTGTYPNAKCYYAKYRLSDYSVVTDWKLLTPTVWGDTGRVNYYNRFLLTESQYDVYIYGGNGAVNRDATSSNFLLSGTTENPGTSMRTFQDIGKGYQSGQYFPGQQNFAMCWQYFYPPTIEELEAKTDKSILQTLKELPSNIAEFFSEKLKALFIPSEDYFDNLSAEFQEYFKERFGVLYEVPDYIISVLETFIEFKPEEEEYKINFPGIKLSLPDESGNFVEHTIIEEQEFNFGEILEITAIKVLYTGYRSFIWLMFIFMLFNLIMRKYNQMLGVPNGA